MHPCPRGVCHGISVLRHVRDVREIGGDYGAVVCSDSADSDVVGGGVEGQVCAKSAAAGGIRVIH
jgi:hypothetical protein